MVFVFVKKVRLVKYFSLGELPQGKIGLAVRKTTETRQADLGG